jgi:hypothetical protein
MLNIDCRRPPRLDMIAATDRAFFDAIRLPLEYIQINLNAPVPVDVEQVAAVIRQVAEAERYWRKRNRLLKAIHTLDERHTKR